jgi:hypothetical protein
MATRETRFPSQPATKSMLERLRREPRRWGSCCCSGFGNRGGGKPNLAGGCAVRAGCSWPEGEEETRALESERGILVFLHARAKNPTKIRSSSKKEVNKLSSIFFKAKEPIYSISFPHKLKCTYQHCSVYQTTCSPVSSAHCRRRWSPPW